MQHGWKRPGYIHPWRQHAEVTLSPIQSAVLTALYRAGNYFQFSEASIFFFLLSYLPFPSVLQAAASTPVPAPPLPTNNRKRNPHFSS